MPDLAHEQARGNRVGYANLQRNRQEWAAMLARKLGNDREAIRRRMQASEQQLKVSDALEASAFYWVTEPMTRVAMDASLDVPDINPDQDMPAPMGLMAFEEILPPLESEDELLPVSALQWYTTGDNLAVVAYVWKGHLDPDDVRAGTLHIGPFLEAFTLHVPRHETKRFDEMEYSNEDQALLALLTTAWRLMVMPTVAERQQIDPKTGRPARAALAPDVPRVTMVYLRPLRHEVKVASDPENGKVYTHRWIVRGHWRNQAYGQGHSLHRDVWIPSYIKGPEGAPVSSSEKVMVWRR